MQAIAGFSSQIEPKSAEEAKKYAHYTLKKKSWNGTFPIRVERLTVQKFEKLPDIQASVLQHVKHLTLRNVDLRWGALKKILDSNVPQLDTLDVSDNLRLEVKTHEKIATLSRVNISNTATKEKPAYRNVVFVTFYNPNDIKRSRLGWRLINSEYIKKAEKKFNDRNGLQEIVYLESHDGTFLIAKDNAIKTKRFVSRDILVKEISPKTKHIDIEIGTQEDRSLRVEWTNVTLETCRLFSIRSLVLKWNNVNVSERLELTASDITGLNTSGNNPTIRLIGENATFVLNTNASTRDLKASRSFQPKIMHVFGPYSHEFFKESMTPAGGLWGFVGNWTLNALSNADVLKNYSWKNLEELHLGGSRTYFNDARLNNLKAAFPALKKLVFYNDIYGLEKTGFDASDEGLIRKWWNKLWNGKLDVTVNGREWDVREIIPGVGDRIKR